MRTEEKFPVHTRHAQRVSEDFSSFAMAFPRPLNMLELTATLSITRICLRAHPQPILVLSQKLRQPSSRPLQSPTERRPRPHQPLAFATVIYCIMSGSAHGATRSPHVHGAQSFRQTFAHLHPQLARPIEVRRDFSTRSRTRSSLARR